MKWLRNQNLKKRFSPPWYFLPLLTQRNLFPAPPHCTPAKFYARACHKILMQNLSIFPCVIFTDLGFSELTLDECCGFIYNDDSGNVLVSNQNQGTQEGENYWKTLYVPGYSSGKLAVGPSTLYGVSPGINTTFKKWTITTSPWTIQTDTDLVIADNAFGTTAGVVVKDDSAIIAIAFLTMFTVVSYS